MEGNPHVRAPSLTFLVVCHGRSGSTWLARELNRSPSWSVEHESKELRLLPMQGEVNGFRRWMLRPSPPAVATDREAKQSKAAHAVMQRYGRIGVIHRDPFEIARSAWHRSAAIRQAWPEFALRLQLWIDEKRKFTNAVQLEFSEMMTDRDYLLAKACELGVEDLPVNRVNFAPCNSSPSGPLPKRAEQVIREAVRDV